MGMKEAETLLTLWRQLERELQIADEDSRDELHARIREVRDRYQKLVAEVYDVEGAGGPTDRSTVGA
jgi:hypothetical protein